MALFPVCVALVCAVISTNFFPHDTSVLFCGSSVFDKQLQFHQNYEKRKKVQSLNAGLYSRGWTSRKKCENQFLYFVLTTARLHYLAPHPPPHTRSVQFVLTQHALNQGHNTREPTTSNILLYFGCFFFGFVRQAPTPPSPTTTKIKLRSSSCILEQNGLKRF